MRSDFRVSVLAVVLFASSSTRATGENDPARAVIDKAVRATGGAEKMALHRAGTWEGKGVYHGFGGVPFTVTGARQGGDQVAITTVSLSPGGAFTRTLVLNRDKGWLAMNGPARELDKEALAEEKERLYGNWVATLLPLTDAAFRLKHLGESKDGGRAVVGVEVNRDGHRPVRLFFDRETGLLAKRETRVKVPQRPGKEVAEEVVFSEYRPADGVKHATRVKLYVDGKLTSETEITAHRPVKALDDTRFARPGTQE